MLLIVVVCWAARLVEESQQVGQRLLTDRENLLKNEQSARERAEKAVAARDQLLSLVSHELRTPLMPVMLLTSGLARRAELPADVQNDVATIREQVLMEVRLIDDLLDLTRLGQNKLVLDRRPMNVHDIVAKIIAELEPAFREKSVELNRDFAAQDSIILGDPIRMRQVLRNLLDNALKFTPAGGSVWMRTFDSSFGRLGIIVKDTGIGIDARIGERVFNAFEQGDPSITRRYGGMGMGLTICKMLIGLHGGTIEVVSAEAGAGATFLVKLPTCEEAVEPAARACTDGAIETQARRRLLLVEDNAATLQAMHRWLRSLGHEVTSVASAGAAIAAARSSDFDLLISDIGLPDMSGWEMMHLLRKSNPMPAIALSGFVSDDDRRKSAESGFSLHLSKPIDLNTLAAAIAEMPIRCKAKSAA